MASAVLAVAAVAALIAASLCTHMQVFRAPPGRREDYTHADFTAWVNEDSWRHEPIASLPFTPLLTCEPNTSVLMRRFDWVIQSPSAWKDTYSASFRAEGNGSFECCGPLDDLPLIESISVPNPETVWAAPHAVKRVLALARGRISTKRPFATIVFSGSEYPLSWAFGTTNAERQATVRALKRYFKRILYQTKDIPLEGVEIAPMGLCWGYMILLLKTWVDDHAERRPMDQAFTDFHNTIHGNLSTKSREVLATGGFVAGWLEDNATMVAVKVLEYVRGLFPPSNSSLRAVHTAFESRMRLRGWLGLQRGSPEVRSPAGLAAGVEYRSLGLQEWWRELPKYKFLLSPLGSGIQAAKNIEALLVLTVPVIQRMGFGTFDELVRLGFPMVVVRGWVEVTPENTSRWWAQLSPRLERFRSNCLSVEGYWRMYTGQVTFCT